MLLIFAIISMMAAVTAYTTGVFLERKAKTLRKSHVIIFWIGLLFDTAGTTAMGAINLGFTLNIHGITGLAALLFMLFHIIWATFVYFKGNESSKNNFHKFSFWVWLIWLIPFISGMLLNM
jgi:uncharacterized repeat protein (TIGR03987 family)